MPHATLDNPRFCDFKDCDRKHYANGLCQSHDTQRKRGLELRALSTYMRTAPLKEKVPCTFDGCDKPSRYKGLCSGHNNQMNRGQELRPLRPRNANGSEVSCTFNDCRNNTRGGAHGLCRGHYRQRLSGSDLSALPDWNDNLSRDDEGRKRCADCRDWLPEDRFHKDSHRPDGLVSNCAGCIRARMLVRTYGVTLETYNRILSEQGGGCAICGDPESSDGSSLAVDHDHTCCSSARSCGKCVRGLLCRSCNQGLGNYRDRPDLLRGAASYLEARSG